MSVIKPEQKQAGRAVRDLRPFQWYAAALMTLAGATPGKPTTGGSVPGLPSDFEVDIATNAQDFGGVIEEPARKGEAVTVITEGRAKIKASGTGQPGDSIKVTPAGMGTKAAPDDLAIGRSYEAWVDGQIVAFQLDKHTAKARGAAFVPPAEPGAESGFIGEEIENTSPTFDLQGGESRTFSYDFTAPGILSLNVFSGAGGTVVVTAASALGTTSQQFPENTNADHLTLMGLPAGRVVLTVTALAAVVGVRLNPIPYYS